MESLTVKIDARAWGVTGIGRYVQELVLHMRLLDRDMGIRLYGAPHEAAAYGADVLPYGGGMYSLREQLLGGSAMRRGGRADLCHFPHYNVPYFRPAEPYVVTVHDLIHFRFPAGHSRLKLRMAHRVLERAVKHAARVICISEATRRDLLDACPAVADKIAVIPQGVSERFSPIEPAAVETFRRQHDLGRFALLVGSCKSHKNAPLAVAAVEQVRQTFPDLALVHVGPPEGLPASPAVRHLGYVTDLELRTLYGAAVCLMFPSQWEGAGLPVLEAMACGCPVVCGPTPSLDDTCGQAAMRSRTETATELAGLLRTLVEDQPTRQRYVDLGLTQARRFSWTQTARLTLDVYSEAAGR